MDTVRSPFSVRKSHTFAPNGNIAYSFRIIKNDESFVVENCVAKIVERKVSVELTCKLSDAPFTAVASSAIEDNNVYRVHTQQLETLHDDYLFLVVLKNKSQIVKSLFMRMAFNKMKNNTKPRSLSDTESEVIDTLLEFGKRNDKMPYLPKHALFGNVGEQSNPPPLRKRNVPAPTFVEEQPMRLPEYAEAFPKRFDFYFPIAYDVADADVELMKTAPEMQIIHLEQENNNHIVLTYNSTPNKSPIVLNYLIPIRLDGDGAGVTVCYDEKTKCNMLICNTDKPYSIPKANRTSKYSIYLDETTNEHCNVHEVTLCYFKPNCRYTYEYDKETGILLFIAHETAHKCHFYGMFSGTKYRMSVDIGKVKEIKSISMEEKQVGASGTKTIAKIVCLEEFNAKFEVSHVTTKFLQLKANVIATYKLQSFNFVEQKENNLLFSFTAIDANGSPVVTEQLYEMKNLDQKWLVPLSGCTRIQYADGKYKCEISFDILRDVRKRNADERSNSLSEQSNPLNDVVMRKKPRHMPLEAPHILGELSNANHMVRNPLSVFPSRAPQLTGVTQMHPTNEILKQSRVDASNTLFSLNKQNAVYSFCTGTFMNTNTSFSTLTTHMNAFEIPPSTNNINGNIHVRGLLSKQLAELYGGIQHVKSYLRGCTLYISILYKNHFINNVFLLDRINHMESYRMAELCKHDTLEYVVIIKPCGAVEISNQQSTERILGMVDVVDVFATNPVTP